MKQRLVLAAGLLLPIWLLRDYNCTKDPTEPESSKRAGAAPAPDLFATTVRPVLSARCAPCHEPGGAMYERLPFDHAEVVASHSAGVLRRIKDPQEKAAIEKWLQKTGNGKR